MKKWLKVLLVTLGVIFIIIAAVLYYSISYIDTTPYFETEYYSNTIKKLNKALGSREKTEGKLQAGFAKINISPRMVKGAEDPSKGEFNNIKLAGFGGGQIATGVHDSIYAKAIALKVNDDLIVLVSGDLLLMAPEVVNKVEENLKTRSEINRKQIYFGATHTHSSIGNCIPGFVGEKFGGKYEPQVVNWLAEKLTSLILKSVSDLQPAQIASGYIHSPNLITNRIIGKTGRLNDKFTLVSIKQLKGKQTVIGIFGAHATTIGDWNSEFSGDYPGYFQRGLEQRGVDMAMFYAGTVGSHTNKGKGSKFDKSKYIGEALADSAMIVLDKMKYSDDVNLSAVAVQIEIPKLQMIYIDDNLRLSPEVGQKLMPEMKRIYLQAFVINNLIWIAMPCELSGEYAIDLQNALELKGYDSAITSFNGQYLGYIVPAKYYYFDAYESRLMGWFGPSMGDYLMELDYTVADSLTGTKL
ncbi:hypothetical protein MNBD_IGNAVI01-1234 [hydrothermal vent metagenome]|uniref:Neutral/alkaline non-lysosomal ceramidase N-terminal domain-containing protein n=1 Tax=hydrothermal vent metagenome TaxID=652676 RepID=A0A3B1C6J7_9ZZZZ